MGVSELVMFYEEMRKLGGFMAVQSLKRWQQVVKVCHFPQTTSSSYSTRNKYESYLLGKETHDMLVALVETQDARALQQLGELALYYFEMLDAGTAKKNLLAPLQEMLAHSRPSLDVLVGVLEQAEPASARFQDAMLCLRAAVTFRCQDLLSAALVARPAAVDKLIDLVVRANDESCEAHIALVLLSLLPAVLTPQNVPAKLESTLARFAPSELPHAVLGHKFLTRLAVRGPVWLLCGFDVMAVVQRITFHMQARRHGVARYFFRLALAVLEAYVATRRWPLSVTDASWDALAQQLVPVTREVDINSPLALQCLRSLLVLQPRLANSVPSEVVFQLPAASAARNQIEEDAYADDEKPAFGFRRVPTLSTAPGSTRKPSSKARANAIIDDAPRRKRGRQPASAAALTPSTPAPTASAAESDVEEDADAESGDLDDDDDGPLDPNETAEARQRRRKRELEQQRRVRIKTDKKVRADMAAERREANSAGVVPAAAAARGRPRRSLQEDEARPGGDADVFAVPGPRRGARTRGRLAAGAEEAPAAKQSRVDAQESLRMALRLASMEDELLDRDVAIASLSTSLHIAQGNSNFLRGAHPVYSEQEAAIVRAHAQAVLQRLARAEIVPAPPRACLHCKATAADAVCQPCGCFAFCTACVPRAGARCAVCGASSTLVALEPAGLARNPTQLELRGIADAGADAVATLAAAE